MTPVSFSRLDLILDDSRRGHVRFESPIGELEIDLAQLDVEPIVRPLGGLDMFVRAERYPSDLRTHDLTMSLTLNRRDLCDRTLLVEATQADGHLAWSSPVYMAC